MVVILMGMVCCAATAFALTEYQTRQITQYLDSPRLLQDQRIFDGKAFNPAVSLDQVTTYYKGYVEQMNRAVQAWNKLSNADRGSADAKPLLTQLQKKVA